MKDIVKRFTEFLKSDKLREVIHSPRNFMWLTAILVVLFLFFLFLPKSCNKKALPTPVMDTVATAQQVWGDVLYYRAHLDTLEKSARLCGLKTRDGKKAEEFDFKGNVLIESQDVINNEWTTLVNENVTVDLNRHQMAATVLYAMRSGKYGFTKSDFLKAVNDGNFAQASEDILKIHDYRGRVIKAKHELRTYLYELRLIWEGNLSIEEILDCHRLSYKLYQGDTYDAKELKRIITTKAKQNKTVRQMIEEVAK